MSQHPQGQMMSTEPDRGTLILVLGILSLTVCALCGPFAWSMGKRDLARMHAGSMNPAGRGLTQGGMICGIIGTVFLILGILFSMVWILFAVILVGATAAGSGAP